LRSPFPKTYEEAAESWRSGSASSRARLARLVERVPKERLWSPPKRNMRKWAGKMLEEFYSHFEFRNEDGTRVKRLAPYQYDVWADRWEKNQFGLPAHREYIKSQKIGQSTTHLLETLHISLQERAWGREILIVGQEQRKAEDHLTDLTEMLRRSIFRPFLIEGPRRDPVTGLVRRDSMSKANLTTLVNPADPHGEPTRIKAVSITTRGGLLSDKRVEHIHMSDIASANATSETIDRGINNAQTRLTKSRGTLVIETMPGSTMGQIYQMYREACRNQARDLPGSDVRRLVPGRLSVHDTGIVRRFPWTIAVDQGVITRAKVEEYRLRCKSAYEFARLYGADFLSSELTAYTNPVRRDSVEAGGLLEACLARIPAGRVSGPAGGVSASTRGASTPNGARW